MELFYILIVLLNTTAYTCQSSENCILKKVNFTIGKLYLHLKKFQDAEDENTTKTFSFQYLTTMATDSNREVIKAFVISGA